MRVEWIATADSAPLDNRPVLIVVDGSVTIGWFGYDGRWRRNTNYCATPQHWAELPPPPM